MEVAVITQVVEYPLFPYRPWERKKKSCGLITRRLTVKSWPILPSRNKHVDAAHF